MADSITKTLCTKSCPLFNKSTDRPRTCPECGHLFKGNGWDGIDVHFRQKKNPHETITGVTYEEWWDSICDDHKS